MSYPNQLLSLLNKYQPIDESDLAHKTKIIHFVENEPDCFKKSLLKGHVTGSAWVVDPSHHKVLLTLHKKLKKWLQLGGHADGESDLLQVAIREAQEESGLEKIFPISTEIFDLDIHLIPSRQQEPEHFHYDIRFMLEASQPELIKKSSESIDLRWIDIERLEEFSNEDSLLQMKKKWLKLKMGKKYY
ncbi:MAG: NUDIX hydrolase [Elusimicrobiota bacterium]